jgi:small GTP-binding protein
LEDAACRPPVGRPLRPRPGRPLGRTGFAASGISQTPLVPAAQYLSYTNAKVLLVGDSGAGKTALSKRIAHDTWVSDTESTLGAWATQLKLPVTSADQTEREIWLWDFGGQADQRLIHQLYMDETALAVLVFDGQKEDLFEALGQWDRDLTRASAKPFSKLLAAGRVDAGGLRVSRTQIEAFATERGFLTPLFETSAKTGIQCHELKQAIVAAIDWQNLPFRSSPALFLRLKEDILRLKDQGRVLLRLNELRDALRLTGITFTDDELKAVVGLLAGPGAVRELEFGSLVLLQPELINAYAQAVIQTLRSDPHERGGLPEARVLSGDLDYHSALPRLQPDDERFVLLAMHKLLLERSLCFREQGDHGPVLIFPSYYRRERPPLTGHPAVLVTFTFNGFLDEIYATLVVRLHHTKPFHQEQLWRYAADFKTDLGNHLGIKAIRHNEGAAQLDVYFDPAISPETKILFSRYVHEHLLQKAKDVVRSRHYVCDSCHTPVENRKTAMNRLNTWLEGQSGAQPPTIVCAECEKRVPLWDELEKHFASDETRAKVHELQQQSQIVLDNESKERALVGQISRELTVSDHGIDMEIEFKNEAGQATGQKLYLQLKSGDSYTRHKSDGQEIFTIPKKRHATYWRDQAFPVFLVLRNSAGEIRWMEIREFLRDAEPLSTQIPFKGERFDSHGRPPTARQGPKVSPNFF